MSGTALRTSILLFAAALGFAACSDDATCLTACENLATCGKLQGSETDCVVACNGDPTVTQGDLDCLASESCSDLASCIPDPGETATCFEMCKKVYDECGSKIADLDEKQCLSLCRSEIGVEKANCVRRAACSRIHTCY